MAELKQTAKRALASLDLTNLNDDCDEAAIDALIAEVQAQRWEKAKDRIESLEDMFKATRLFRK